MAEPVPTKHVEEAIGWRRDLHRHPELAYQEERTADFVARQLTAFGLSVRRGYGGTGLVASLTRGTSRRVIGLRADMDALPIAEATGAEHASTRPGVMHACGHDGHVAMLVAAARELSSRPGLDGTIHFIFQPAEEVEGGAHAMARDGLFSDFPLDEIYAIHNWPALPPGHLVARDDAMMAAFATFDIVVTGRGAHGAMPHQGADPVLAAGQLVAALQGVVARNVSPLESAVVSVTQIHGGDAYNVIPETVNLKGTTRWFEPAVGDLLETRMRQTAEGIAAAFGCRADLRYDRLYPATINAPEPAAHVRDVAARITGLTVETAPPSMAAEDFAFMLQQVPGAYIWLGAGRTGENPGLHSPRFDFNDAILADGVAFWRDLAAARLAAA
ncbi:M20 aminoacylase family protein [Aureimonas frigidaquae]|uniref:M20 aminoacylase family protein n=1 Tax=Aureimonas frigidaquae TaxID=424757 RepID=UPI000780A735|nr:M20 aminoacylase family protein [Aureimonas frigidaquae]